MEAGVDVLAAADGMVKATRDGMADPNVAETGVDAVKDVECGNGVLIEHDDGWSTQYCHMKKGSIRVREGDTVHHRDAARRGRPVGHDRVPARPLHGAEGRHRGRPLRARADTPSAGLRLCRRCRRRRSGRRRPRQPSSTVPPSCSMPASPMPRSRWSRSSRVKLEDMKMSPAITGAGLLRARDRPRERRRPAPRHPRAGRLRLRRERGRAARPAQGPVLRLHRQEAQDSGMAVRDLARTLLRDPERRRGRVPRSRT